MKPTHVSKIRAQRLADEAAFHDEAFVQHTRQNAWKFYDAASDAYGRFGELLAAAISDGSKALEYGCGPGSHAFELARRGAIVDGIDISPVAIDLAREAAEREGVASATTFSVMDGEHLEFPADSFDLVCGTSIIHHLDVDRAYAEVARVLKPGGVAVFLETLGHNPAINLYRRLTPSLRTEDEHPLRMQDIAAAQRYFTSVGSEHFGLLALAAIALHGTPAFERALERLQRADRALFGAVPPFRRWSWIAVLNFAGPLEARVRSR